MLLLAVAAGVSLTPLAAQSRDFAKVIDLQGQVSVDRGGAVPLFQNSTVRTKEEITTGPDGHAVFQLSDGSSFEVFPNSRVAFRDTFNFQELLNLVLGKIRVQIEHKNGPNHKKVYTPTAVISVRGTIFDVSVEVGGITLVSVEEGEVEVSHRLQPNSTTKILNQQNPSIRVYPDQPLAKVTGPNPGAIKFVFDKIRGAVIDIAVNNPGGIPGGGTAGGPQADKDKNKKIPPAGGPPAAPPAAPPPVPPGGGN